MRKLSEIQNEDALDVIAEIIDPVIEISQDEEIKKLTSKKDRLGAVQVAIKNHKKAVLKVLAILDGESPETYKVNIIQIPVKVMELLNDKDMQDFFQSQGLIPSDASSGSVTENIKATEKK